MKLAPVKYLILFLLLVAGIPHSVFSQAPQGFNYQAVIRNSSAEIIEDSLIMIRMSILKDSINGISVYQESHQCTTTDAGVVKLQIGNGTIESGNFSMIDWRLAAYWIRAEVDPESDGSYFLAGTTQLLSVPYAFHADSISNDRDEQQFSFSSDTLFISGGNYVLLNGIYPTLRISEDSIPGKKDE